MQDVPQEPVHLQDGVITQTAVSRPLFLSGRRQIWLDAAATQEAQVPPALRKWQERVPDVRLPQPEATQRMERLPESAFEQTRCNSELVPDKMAMRVSDRADEESGESRRSMFLKKIFQLRSNPYSFVKES
ncbi:protein of unknown function [Sterolibacterium denitrificans]|uniref:Uncharacterized protein n=2 Tax=Sterolibacterium denitrificans TaxID=157592 RepID=A0A7Z7MUN0_9PROT|nr:hypothetical protein [Sterolibacterium denitrificans]KYC28944.1 hypothetical protein ACY05_03595 [Sterolibacterium denitrificans]SMB23203.1 protein of unknown function [Sterolibacterium denitrificans]